MRITVEQMKPEDWPAVREIYGAGIDTGQASFEVEVPDWRKFSAKYAEPFRLVARDENGVVQGWAALTEISARRVYAGVRELSVYVAPAARRQGVGEALLRGVISASESAGIWMIQAGVFLENEASIRVHKKCGFREVGRRERIAKRDGVWRDTLLLERRSSVAGLD